MIILPFLRFLVITTVLWVDDKHKTCSKLIKNQLFVNSFSIFQSTKMYKFNSKISKETSTTMRRGD